MEKGFNKAIVFSVISIYFAFSNRVVAVQELCKQSLQKGAKVGHLYEVENLTAFSETINIEGSSPDNIVIIKLAWLAGATDPVAAKSVAKAFESQPKTVQKLLVKELNKSGVWIG